MKFSDELDRTSLEEVLVKRTEKDMESREEASSDLWDIEEYNISKYEVNTKEWLNLYRVPARDVRVGETIRYDAFTFIAYRTE